MIEEEELSNEDKQWLDFDNRPVIYISFGTLVIFPQPHFDELLSALYNATEYRVLWKVKDYEKYL